MKTPYNHPNAIAHLSADSGFFTLTLQEGGKQLGVLEGYLASGWVSVNRVEVPQESRGQGIATRLMRHLEELAASRGCTVCHVQLFSGFDAQGFFEAIGYTAMPADMSSQGDVARIYMDRQLHQEKALMVA